MPASIFNALTKMKAICQSLEERLDGDSATPEEEVFLDSSVDIKIDGLLHDIEAINEGTAIPSALNQEAAERELIGELLYLSPNGSVDEVLEHQEYQEKLGALMDSNTAERLAAAKAKSTALVEDLWSLRRELSTAFTVHPDIDNT